MLRRIPLEIFRGTFLEMFSDIPLEFLQYVFQEFLPGILQRIPLKNIPLIPESICQYVFMYFAGITIEIPPENFPNKKSLQNF